MAPSPTTLARGAGALLGAGAAAFVLVEATPSASFASLPAKATFTVTASGELAVEPPPPRAVLTARTLEPGDRPVRSTFVLRNQTGKALAVVLRAEADGRDLDGLLRVRIAAGGRELSDTTLQGLREGMQAPVRLRSGAARRVTLETWIPASVTDGHQGRTAAVTLTPTLKAGS